ncbi:MAG: isocitrate/isopropylmalate family dehydrogenase [Patescibacteria group bacterium]|nr:isocitrate/isopropylmalate family dehydrogenase [Patescibacteria group bacterium]MDD5554730.1 isocitrate/isopropylmalate family dehydrogenase [Patescibacteria group bacterium]
MKKIIALVRGDGSGPEMMAVACAVAVEAAKKDGVEIVFEETPMGWCAYKEYGDTLPPQSFKRAVEIGTIFFGAVGDPAFDNTIGGEKPEMKPEARCLLALRKRMALLLNFRPMIFYPELRHLSPLRPELIPDWVVKQIFIRFLLQDTYFGNLDLMDLFPIEIRVSLGIKLKKDVIGDEDMITDLAYFFRETVEKYMRAAFIHAQQLGLPLISVDKANVMSRYEFWRKIATKIGGEFPDVPLRHQFVDSANALLFVPEKLHGVIACGNEHGDILSDGAAAALGSMGMMCSSAINPDTGAAMFESGAGTAPSLAGQDKANPLGRILSAALMLRHIGAPVGAEAIEKAVMLVLRDGWRTADLSSGTECSDKIIGTRAMGEKVLSYL